MDQAHTRPYVRLYCDTWPSGDNKTPSTEFTPRVHWPRKTTEGSGLGGGKYTLLSIYHIAQTSHT